MARKKKLELDEFGFDRDLEMPDFNFDAPPPKQDRNPVLAAGRSFLKGAAGQVKSESFIRRMIKSSLPKGYGSAMDLADEISSSVNSLYHTAAKEIKPLKGDLARTAASTLPMAEKKLPKSIVDRQRKLAEMARTGSGTPSAEQMRDASIAAMMNDVFKNQQESAAHQDRKEESREQLRQGLEQIRHRDSVSQLNAIRMGVQQLAMYQERVGNQYQRKMLELNYRKYFLAMEAFEEQKRTSAMLQQNLEAISKNTSLPDFVKLQTKERFAELMRNKFLGGMSDMVFDRRRNFLQGVTQRLGANIKGAAQGFAGGVRMGLSGVEAMADAARLEEEMAELTGERTTGTQRAAGIAGSFGADYLGSKIGAKLRGRAEKNPRLVRGGNRLQYLVNNFPQLAEQYARSGKHESGPLGGLVRFFKNSIPGQTDFKVGRDSVKDLQAPSVFTRQAAKSLTEIIPGFLARIHQELQIIRTGDANAPLLSYDFNRNKFDTQANVRRAAFDSMFDSGQTKYNREDTDRLIDEVEKSSGKKLSKREREDLGRRLLQDNLNNGLFSKERMTDSATFGGGLRGKKYAQLFSKHLANDTTGQKLTDTAEKFSNLGRWAGDPRALIQSYINAGQEDFLIDAGIIKPDGTIDEKKLYAYFYGDKYTPSGAGANPMTGGGFTARPSMASSAPAFAASPARADGMDACNCDEILEAIQRADQSERLDKANETLLRIEKRLDQPLAMLGVGQVDGPPPAGAADNKRWWQKSIGDMLGGAGRGAARLGRLGNRIAETGFGAVRQGAMTGFGLARSSAGAALNVLKGTFSTGINDVFVLGEKLPRLSALKLKAGEYRDAATGKVIKSFKDIKGDVVDAAGNIVLRKDEIKTAVMKAGAQGKSHFLTALGAVTKFGNDAVNQAFSAATGVYGTALGMAKNLVGKFLDGPRDVYIKGKEDPVLLARIMRAGGYRSKRTGKVIAKVGDIDGTVINDDDEVVLTEDDMKTGLLDQHGKPIRTGLGKLVGMVTDTAGKVLGAGKRIGNFLLGGAKDAIEGFKDLLGGIFGGLGGRGARKTRGVLYEIRDILLERLPKPKRRVIGDSTGDGIRDGSYADLKRLRDARAAKKEGEAQERKGGKGLLGSMGAGFAALMDKLRGKKEGEEEEGGDGDTYLLGGGGDSDGKDKKGGKKGKGWKETKGFWNKAKWLGGKGLSGLGSAAKWGANLLGMGGILGAAGSFLGGAASLAGSAISGAVGLGGTVLSGLASIVGAPVLLGAAATAAIGYGGYKAYQYFTKKTLDTWSTIRYAQYGFLPSDEKNLQTVLGLEDLARKGLVKGQGGSLTLGEKEFNIAKALNSFGVDMDNKRNVERFMRWFHGRFKPVYLTTVNTLWRMTGSDDLDKIDSKLEDKDKAKFLEIIKFPEGPYGLLDSPLPGQRYLKAGPSEVKNLVELAEAKIAKGESKSDDAKADDKAKAAVFGMAAAPAVVENAGGAAFVSRKGQAGKLDSKAIAGIKSNTGAGSTQASTAGMISVTGQKALFSRASGGKVDELTAIRFKTYGLNSMDAAKVRTLDTLEDYVLKRVAYSGEKAAYWSGSVEQASQALAPVFGIGAINTDEGYDWITWFNQRFLPVFMNYLTALHQATGKLKPEQALATLNPNQAIDVAMATYTTMSKFGGETKSVWGIPTSPWAGYVLNSESKSTELNMQSLKDQAKRTVLEEKQVSDAGLEKAKREEAKEGEEKPGFWSRLFGSDKKKTEQSQGAKPTLTENEGGAAFVYRGRARTDGAAAAQAADQADGGSRIDRYRAASRQAREAMARINGNYESLPGSAAGGAAGMGGGVAVQHPGNGTGGSINDLPEPKGNKSWTALKDLIIGASKMAGVDKGLMATMAAIESGFNWQVKAGTSSATGLYQFIKSTWQTMLQRYGAKYGIAPNTPPTDPRANALMGAEFLKENTKALQGVVNRPLTDTDMYLAHFLGAGGARQFLRADPNAIAATAMPAAARANASIFYKNGRPLTFAEVYQVINGRVRSKGKQFGIDTNTPETAAGAAAGAAADQTAARVDDASGPVTASLNNDPVKSQDPKLPGQTPAPSSSSSFAAPGAPAVASTATQENPIGPVGVTPTQPVQFQPSAQTLSLQEQQRYQKQLQDQGMGPTNEILTRSLDVQSQILAEIKGLSQKLGERSQTAPAANDANPVDAAVQTRASRQQPQAMPRSPVSMAHAT